SILMHPPLARNVGGNDMTVVEFHPEHRIVQRFDNRPVLFDSSLFCHRVLNFLSSDEGVFRYRKSRRRQSGTFRSVHEIAFSLIPKFVSTSGPSLRMANANSKC